MQCGHGYKTSIGFDHLAWTLSCLQSHTCSNWPKSMWITVKQVSTLNVPETMSFSVVFTFLSFQQYLCGVIVNLKKVYRYLFKINLREVFCLIICPCVCWCKKANAIVMELCWGRRLRQSGVEKEAIPFAFCFTTIFHKFCSIRCEHSGQSQYLTFFPHWW